MERQEIFDKIESIFDECKQRNKGFNESELDTKETITDYIFKNLALSDVVSSVLCISDGGFNYIKKGKKYELFEEDKYHYYIDDEMGESNRFKKNLFKKL